MQCSILLDCFAADSPKQVFGDGEARQKPGLDARLNYLQKAGRVINEALLVRCYVACERANFRLLGERLVVAARMRRKIKQLAAREPKLNR